MGAGFRVVGVPKGMAQRLKLLTLDVTPSGAIERMRLEEIDGAVTEFEFSEMQENVPVKNEDFVFTPPAGCDRSGWAAADLTIPPGIFV